MLSQSSSSTPDCADKIATTRGLGRLKCAPYLLAGGRIGGFDASLLQFSRACVSFMSLT